MRAWKTSLGVVTLLAVLTATVHTTGRAPFDRIVVFGASFHHPGNAFALRGGANTPPDYLIDPLLVPSAPYTRVDTTSATAPRGSNSLPAP